MTIRRLPSDSSGQVGAIDAQLEKLPDNSSGRAATPQTSKPVIDTNFEQRRAGQSARSRTSIGSTFRQQQLSGLLTNSELKGGWSDAFSGYISKIALAAGQADPTRRANTMQTLANAQ